MVPISHLIRISLGLITQCLAIKGLLSKPQECNAWHLRVLSRAGQKEPRARQLQGTFYGTLYILFLNIWFDFFFFLEVVWGLGWGLYIFAYRCPIALVLFVKKPILYLHWIPFVLWSKIVSSLGLCWYHLGWEEGHLPTAPCKASTSTVGVAWLLLSCAKKSWLH